MHSGHVDLSRRNRSCFQLAGTVSGRTAFDKLVVRATVCRGEEAEISQCEELEATELSGVEEREDRMTDEEGRGF